MDTSSRSPKNAWPPRLPRKPPGDPGDGRLRCPWAIRSEIECQYHDTEWGVLIRNNSVLFEYLILDTFQAGLSWQVVMQKRAALKHFLFDFDPAAMWTMSDSYLEVLMLEPAIICKQPKLRGARQNALAYLQMQAKGQDFSTYLWRFTDGQVIEPGYSYKAQVRTVSPQAKAMASGLKKQGFTFCRPVTCYAFMQAAGIMNDHLRSCFRHEEVQINH